MSIKITIPTVEHVKDGDQIKAVHDNLELSVDTSFNAHLKWEEHFQQIKGIDLSTMTAIVQVWIKDPKEAAKHMPDLMRVLYCFVDSDKLPTFSHFVKMLNQDNFVVFIEKISTVIQEVGKTASKN